MVLCRCNNVSGGSINCHKSKLYKLCNLAGCNGNDQLLQQTSLPYTGNIWRRGKFWRIMQVKAIGEEKIGESSVHMPNTFSVYLWILVRKILTKMAHDSPNSSIFPYQNFPVYGMPTECSAYICVLAMYVYVWMCIRVAMWIMNVWTMTTLTILFYIR